MSLDSVAYALACPLLGGWLTISDIGGGRRRKGLPVHRRAILLLVLMSGLVGCVAPSKVMPLTWARRASDGAAGVT